MKAKHPALFRFLVGGVCGVGAMLLWALIQLVILRTCFGNDAPYLNILVTYYTAQFFGSRALALLVQSILLFALGGMAGLATLPFAEGGKELVRNSVLHFVVTAVFFSMLILLCGNFNTWRPSYSYLPAYLGLLLAVYLVIWLARWVGWFTEAAAIREKLGLSPGPSLFHWKETLPHLLFAGFLCLFLPLALKAVDAVDVPVLTGIVYPFLILPAGCAAAGMSLGKRQGFRPIYPAACGLFEGLTALLFWAFNMVVTFHILIALCAALLGLAVGAAIRHRKGG